MTTQKQRKVTVVINDVGKLVGVYLTVKAARDAAKKDRQKQRKENSYVIVGKYNVQTIAVSEQTRT